MNVLKINDFLPITPCQQEQLRLENTPWASITPMMIFHDLRGISLRHQIPLNSIPRAILVPIDRIWILAAQLASDQSGFEPSTGFRGANGCSSGLNIGFRVISCSCVMAMHNLCTYGKACEPCEPYLGSSEHETQWYLHGSCVASSILKTYYHCSLKFRGRSRIELYRTTAFDINPKPIASDHKHHAVLQAENTVNSKVYGKLDNETYIILPA